MNPSFNLILTIRLKEEVTMNKKGWGKAFIHSLCSFPKVIFGEKMKRETEGLKSFSKLGERLIFRTQIEKANGAQKSRRDSSR